ALALGGGWLLESAWRRGRTLGAAATAGSAAVVAGAAWWLDSIRDTKRIVVTPFVEARWVGGLDPDGIPKVTIIVVTFATLGLAAFIRLRWREGTFERDLDGQHALPRHAFAALLVGAIAVGLAPASAERLEKTWQPEAYVRAQRNDSTFTRIEVYPPKARQVIADFPDGSVVLAAFNDTRRIASLAPVYSIEESVLRQVVSDPPAPGAEAARRLDELVREWDASYVAANAFDKPFRPMLEAAAADPARYELIASGNLRVYRVLDAPAATASS
ncbi:MAG: hypothetical protein JWM86_403, partial [Thermoleophilia bacterium]|nr:hypothetical protein [Thermoleophilia bacterium]